jgi:hypothetical protein
MMRHVLAVLLVAWLVPAPACASDEPRPHLDVSITLEDSVFLEGQSIYAIFRTQNRGGAEVQHIAPLAPEYGFMTLTLVSSDRGGRFPCLIDDDLRYIGKGVTLRPGEVMCDARDLTTYFGLSQPNPASVAGGFGYPELPVGRYSLHWEYRYSIQAGEATRITGKEISFVVNALTSEPKEQQLIEAFMRGKPRVGLDRSPFHEYSQQSLPRFLGSRYLMRVYMSTGPLLKTSDFDQIFSGVRRNGAPPQRRAALLAARLTMTDYKGRFTSAWKQGMRPGLSTQLERDVLTIEPRHP